MVPTAETLYLAPRGAALQPAAFPGDCVLYLVDSRGYFRRGRREIYAAAFLAGHTVGMRAEADCVEVWLYTRRIGILTASGDRVVPWNVHRSVIRAA